VHNEGEETGARAMYLRLLGYRMPQHLLLVSGNKEIVAS
jgi:hypothetical protein